LNAYERKIIVDDNHFTKVETHFADAKFYLKSYVVKGEKSIDVKSINSDKVASIRINVVVGKVKVDTKAPCHILNKGKIMSLKKKLTYVLRYDPKVKKKKVNHLTLKKNTLRGLTFPIRQINAINLSSKLQERQSLKIKCEMWHSLQNTQAKILILMLTSYF